MPDTRRRTPAQSAAVVIKQSVALAYPYLTALEIVAWAGTIAVVAGKRRSTALASARR
jgi:hypothetical protein